MTLVVLMERVSTTDMRGWLGAVLYDARQSTKTGAGAELLRDWRSPCGLEKWNQNIMRVFCIFGSQQHQ